MTVYFDSSALVAVYVSEVHSERARRELRKSGPVPWTPLHELEVGNALRLLHGRRQIDEAELRGLLGHLEDDLARRRLARPTIDLEAAFRRAEELSQKHASKTLARALDILHIAVMIEVECRTLVSGDERQIELARSEGLRAIDIRSSP